MIIQIEASTSLSSRPTRRLAARDGAGLALLEGTKLAIAFATVGGRVQAVNEISYAVETGEIVATAGESGSG